MEEDKKEELDKDVLKLLACVKFKHPNINDKISDPEIYLILQLWLYQRRFVHVHSCIFNTTKAISCIHVVEKFPYILEYITQNGKHYKQNKNNKYNNKPFMPSTQTAPYNVSCNALLSSGDLRIFEFATIRLTKNKSKDEKQKIIDEIQQRCGCNLTINKIDGCKQEYNQLQQTINTFLKMFEIKNESDLKQIYDEINNTAINTNPLVEKEKKTRKKSK